MPESRAQKSARVPLDDIEHATLGWLANLEHDSRRGLAKRLSQRELDDVVRRYAAAHPGAASVRAAREAGDPRVG
ncbi:MAG: hypothetical protein AAFZ07_20095 [Actinomycetota bacterium]